MDKILHDPKDPKLWELWYIPYNGNAGFCPSTVVMTVKLWDDNSLWLRCWTEQGGGGIAITEGGLSAQPARNAHG